MGWDGCGCGCAVDGERWLRWAPLRTADDTAGQETGRGVLNARCTAAARSERHQTEGGRVGRWVAHRPSQQGSGAIQACSQHRSGRSSASRPVGRRNHGICRPPSAPGHWGRTGLEALHLSINPFQRSTSIPLRRRLPAPRLLCSGFLASARPGSFSLGCIPTDWSAQVRHSSFQPFSAFEGRSQVSCQLEVSRHIPSDDGRMHTCIGAVRIQQGGD